jgi:hypothetical protein
MVENCCQNEYSRPALEAPIEDEEGLLLEQTQAHTSMPRRGSVECSACNYRQGRLRCAELVAFARRDP